MTIDDVDFTVLAATSVLNDLVPICPPAESCRDAFVRMSKATISMVMSTTAFGNRSTLATQPLNNPESYFGNRSNMEIKREQTSPRPSRRRLPKFDMNLKDLFSEEEIASRPLTQQPTLQGFARSFPKQPPISPHLPTNASLQSNEGASQYQNSPRGADGRPPASSSPYQTSYPPASFTEPVVPQPDYSFDNLDFLNEFVVGPTDSGANDMWGPGAANDHGGGGGGMDLGFGNAGNNGFDGSGAWEANADIFDTFFFGSSGGNGY